MRTNRLQSFVFGLERSGFRRVYCLHEGEEKYQIYAHENSGMIADLETTDSGMQLLRSRLQFEGVSRCSADYPLLSRHLLETQRGSLVAQHNMADNVLEVAGSVEVGTEFHSAMDTICMYMILRRRWSMRGMHWIDFRTLKEKEKGLEAARTNALRVCSTFPSWAKNILWDCI